MDSVLVSPPYRLARYGLRPCRGCLVKDRASCYGGIMKNEDQNQPAVVAGQGWVMIQVKVQPRASANEILGVVEGALRVRIKAPPVEGKANRALQAFLAKLLAISKRDV